MSLDYIGFTYRGRHSSEFNILRVTSGSRYQDSLTPPIEDKVVAIPGGHGAYLFGSTYGIRQFEIDIAYDSMTETNIRELRKLMGEQTPAPLIFDESPYKVYMVKPSIAPTLAYVPFGTDAGGRVYKGEGVLQFVAHFPFARAKNKYLNEYSDTNIDEWSAASGLKASKGNHDTFSVNNFPIFNPGDIETDWNVLVPFVSGAISELHLYLEDRPEDQLKIRSMTRKNLADTKIRINSKLNLIEGIDNLGKPTGSIYNDHIKSGNFFKIPVNFDARFYLTGSSAPTIEYDILYL